MRLIAILLPLAIVGCRDASADPMELSKACVAEAAKGSKVSAARANEIVASCQIPINDWTDGSMRNACRGECDFTDSRNVQERADRKAKIEEILMMSISDEVQLKYVRM